MMRCAMACAGLLVLSTACSNGTRTVSGQLDLKNLGHSQAELIALSSNGTIQRASVGSDGRFATALRTGTSYSLAFKDPSYGGHFAQLVFQAQKGHRSTVRVTDGDDINLGTVTKLSLQHAMSENDNNQGDNDDQGENDDDQGDDNDGMKTCTMPGGGTTGGSGGTSGGGTTSSNPSGGTNPGGTSPENPGTTPGSGGTTTPNGGTTTPNGGTTTPNGGTTTPNGGTTTPNGGTTTPNGGTTTPSGGTTTTPGGGTTPGSGTTSPSGTGTPSGGTTGTTFSFLVAGQTDMMHMCGGGDDAEQDHDSLRDTDGDDRPDELDDDPNDTGTCVAHHEDDNEDDQGEDDNNQGQNNNHQGQNVSGSGSTSGSGTRTGGEGGD
jgi:hypothetical protein